MTDKILEYKICKETFPTGYGSWKQLQLAELKHSMMWKRLSSNFVRITNLAYWVKLKTFSTVHTLSIRHKHYKQIAAALHYCDGNLALLREHVDYNRLYKVKFERYYQPGP